MHILVIGGTRFMGPFVIRQLHEQGHSQSEAFKQTVLWERANPPDEIDPSDFDYEAEDMVLAELQRDS